MTAGGTIPGYSADSDSVPAFISPAAYLMRSPEPADSYVCPHCQRSRCHRCTERDCTCCTGVPDGVA
jgi:hypothetical protein